MGLPALLDEHFPTHGNWQGLSLGWVANRLWTLHTTMGQAVTRLDFSDDRLESVRRSLHDNTRWTACEAALNQHTVRVYDLSCKRVHVDSTSASAYTSVSDGGVFQFGHSKDHRPDLPQVKVLQEALNQRGRKRFEQVAALQRVVHEIVQRHEVVDSVYYDDVPFCIGHMCRVIRWPRQNQPAGKRRPRWSC